MSNSLTQRGYVKKSGDIMTGDLNLGLNDLILNDGLKGGVLRGNSAGADSLQVVKIDLSNVADIVSRKLTVTDDINMSAGKTVDGIDISEVKQAKVLAGSYTGNGADNREIDIGVDLTAKYHVYIIIQSMDSHAGQHRIETGQGDASNMFHTVGEFTNKIQNVSANGFEIGSHNDVNENTKIYRYIVLYEE